MGQNQRARAWNDQANSQNQTLPGKKIPKPKEPNQEMENQSNVIKNKLQDEEERDQNELKYTDWKCE